MTDRDYPPYTTDEIIALAEKYVARLSISDADMREDARAEYVAAAWEASQKPTVTRSYQETRGTGATIDYLKREMKWNSKTQMDVDELPTEMPVDDPQFYSGCDLTEAIEFLPDQMRDVMLFRYAHDLTQGETAQGLGLSQQRVSQIEASAKALVREWFLAGDGE